MKVTHNILIMSKLFYLIMFLAFPVLAIAETVAPAETGQFVVDLTSFAGITALVGSALTQILKFIPGVSDKKWAQVLLAIVVGIAIVMAVWGLQLSEVVNGLLWWQAMLVGLASGLSSCGFYDIVKAIYNLFSGK